MIVQVISSAVLVIVMLVFMLVVWKIYKNIEQVMIVSGEYIGEEIQAVNTSMTVLRKENKILREEVTRQVKNIADVIVEADNTTEVGMNSLVMELKQIVPALREEMTNLQKTLSENAITLQKSALTDFEGEVKRFIKVIDTACDNLNKATQDQSKQMASVAGTVQGVLNTFAKNLQSEFEKADTDLRKTITKAMKQIDSDYQENMRNVFNAMADNLAAIIEHLRKEGNRNHA